MKRHLLFAGLMLSCASALAVGLSEPAVKHRYVVERTFPQGALDQLDALTKMKVNKINSEYGVTWVMSYATADRTRTFCIYEGPNEEAIRAAARANHMSANKITEVPVTVTAE